MGLKQGFAVALLAGAAALMGGCAELPDRLDNLADAGRDFAVSHPLMGRTAVMAARAALRKPQHVRLVCDPQCLVKQ